MLVLAELLTTAANAVTAAAVVLGVLALASSRSVHASLPVFLDLLLAAGLLRLAAADSWEAIATAAVVVAVRRLVASALSRRQVPQKVRYLPKSSGAGAA